MEKEYVNDKQLQIAMTEYNDNSINRDVNDQYDRSVSCFLYQKNYKTTNPWIRGFFSYRLVECFGCTFC